MVSKIHLTVPIILSKTIQHVIRSYFIIISISTNPKEEQQLSNSKDRDYYVPRGQKRVELGRPNTSFQNTDF